MAMQISESQSNDGEISLMDIVNFLQESWKKLAIAAVLGGALGLSGWFFLGSYQAELVLLNNGGIDLVGLRSLQKSLPNLADQIIDEGKVPQGQESIYRTLSNSDWWQKNLLPNYAMTKADSKELASTAGLESAGSSIVSLTMMVRGSSKKSALEGAQTAKNFLLQGASYLAIKSLINSQESRLSSADAYIAKKINSAQVELGYQQERLKNLEGLAKRFPNESRVISQVIDPKDSGAKYMPISTQIIATNTDINDIKETLERLKDEQAQTVVLRTWVNQASPIIEGSYDGLALIKKLLEQESQLRASLDLKNPKSQVFVDDLRSILIGFNVRFTKGLEVNTSPVISKKDMIKTMASGLASGFFLMLLVLLSQRVWINARGDGAR